MQHTVDTKSAAIVSVYGQSNADTTPMDDPLIWGKCPMSDHVLMLDDTVRARGGLRGWRGVPAPGADGLVPAMEDTPVFPVQSYGTAAASRLISLRGEPFSTFAVRSSAHGGQKIVGETPTMGLWKDSAGHYTIPWLNWTQDLRDMRDALAKNGFTLTELFICFTHQEADWKTSRTDYFAQFERMKQDRERLLAQDFPDLKVHWFVDQASGVAARTKGKYGGAWPARLAIQDCAQAFDNVTMVMPRYWMTFGHIDGVRDHMHHSFESRIWQGEMYGHAMHAITQGQPWYSPYPVMWEARRRRIKLTFKTLLSLKLDSSFCKTDSTFGFQVDQGRNPIRSVRVRNGNEVLIHCDHPVQNQKVRYAYRDQTPEDVPSNSPISTGGLRDKWQMPSEYLPGKTLVRAAVAFEIKL